MNILERTNASVALNRHDQWVEGILFGTRTQTVLLLDLKFFMNSSLRFVDIVKKLLIAFKIPKVISEFHWFLDVEDFRFDSRRWKIWVWSILIFFVGHGNGI